MVALETSAEASRCYLCSVKQPTRTDSQATTRARIVDVAAQLLRDEGPSAVTTRGVALGAGVQAPAIYRLFGDKDGLLEAVAEKVMADFVATKAAIVEDAAAEGLDPLDDLRAGWDSQIAFGSANPVLFQLLSDPMRVRDSPAARSGRAVLAARVHRIAVAGRLRVSEDRAVGIIQAAGVGAIQTLLASPEQDAGLADAMYQAVLEQILTDAPERDVDGALAATVGFRAIVPQLDMLTDAERLVLVEWLDRAIAGL
jgi:AcrR family transcriptional regulator